MHWSRIPESGSRWGLQFVLSSYRLLGYRFASWCLWPVVAYYWLFRRRARAASQDYLHRLYRAYPGCLGHAPGWRDSFHHLLAFAHSGLDKLAAWAGDPATRIVSFPARATFEAETRRARGVLLVGAHLGNLEMTRALAREVPGVVINAVVYTDHAQRFNELLARIDPEFGINLIQVSSLGPDTAILLKEKIARGEWLVIVGDRTPPGDAPDGGRRTVEAPFLGQSARFAQGPWILAHLLECPVYLFFCLRMPQGDYRIFFEPFAERIHLPRGRREAEITRHVTRYAARLEGLCAQAPLQWFNFYEFWQTATHTQPE